MRSCLHSLLVGVLAFSLSIDVARACGHLRRWRCCPPPCAASLPVVPNACGAGVAMCAVPVCDCGWGAAVTVGAFGDCEVVVASHPLDCGASDTVTGPPITVAGEPVVAEPAPATESVVAPEPPPGASNGPAPIAAVPHLEPVEPVSATEPAPEMPPEEPAAPEPGQAEEPGVVNGEAEEPSETEEPAADVAMPEEGPAPQPEPPPASPPRNVFEEEADAGDERPGDLLDAAEPPALPEPPAVPPFDAGADPADGAGVETVTEDTVPVDAPPAVDAPGDAPLEPATEPPAETGAAAEPLRRWIDDTASFAVVGRLVAVEGDRVEIVKADGRRLTVPLANISGFDRDYVAEAAPRLAASGPRDPRPTDTASR